MSQDLSSLNKETGFLLLSDMIDSTRNKSRLWPTDAYKLVEKHNEIVISVCQNSHEWIGEKGAQDQTNYPIKHATIVKPIGDCVVVKFPREISGMIDALRAARRIIWAFDEHPLIQNKEDKLKNESGTLRLSTKILLHYYNSSFGYKWRYVHFGESNTEETSDILGYDIDLAFRLLDVPFRQQVIASQSFTNYLLFTSRLIEPTELSPDDVKADFLLQKAAAIRDRDESEVYHARDIHMNYKFQCGDIEKKDSEEYWILDARIIPKPKGIIKDQEVYLLSFDDPSIESEKKRNRLRIKIRQEFHAVILASISSEFGNSQNYITQILSEIDSLSNPYDRMDAKLTVCVAAKIYGNYDFFFRVSCQNDLALNLFYNKLKSIENYKVASIDIRQTITGRFYVNKLYHQTLKILRQSNHINHFYVLTWFEHHPNLAQDVFETLTKQISKLRPDPALDEKSYLQEADANLKKELANSGVLVLECGEVIHHNPFYAIFACQSMKHYEDFFENIDIQLNNTKATSYIFHTPNSNFCKLRYHLVEGIFIPPLDEIISQEQHQDNFS